MKIAVCFSGQIRMGTEAYKSILHFLEGLEVDFFIHTWDINDSKRFFGDTRTSPKYTHSVKTELGDYIKINDIYKPKKIKLEINHEYRSKLNEINYNVAPLWHSWYESILLKDEYEKENGFIYDVVLKMRFDTIFDSKVKLKEIIKESKNDIKNGIFFVDTLTKYSYDVGSVMIHDVIFMSNSKTMTLASNYYKDIVLSENRIENYHTDFHAYLTGKNIECNEFLPEKDYKWTIYRKWSEGYHPVDNFYECLEVNRILFNDDFPKIENVKIIGYNMLVQLKNKIYKETGFAPNALKNVKSMKIAICLSGQFRTYDKCYQHVIALKRKIESDPNSRVDFFCHMWDFESESRPILDVTFNDNPSVYPKEKIDEILSIYQPKKYIIENYEKNQKVNNDVIEIGKEKYPQHEGVPITWCANQFYAIMRASELKRQYEIEENFEYDVCVRLRYDQYIPNDQVYELLNYLLEVKPNTIHSIHNREIDVYPHFSIGDVFWFSDSVTFDKICSFYRILPSIDLKIFEESKNHLLPEFVFYHFIKTSSIENFTTLLKFYICKDDDFIRRKIMLNLGGLGDNEVLYKKIKVVSNTQTISVNSLL